MNRKFHGQNSARKFGQKRKARENAGRLAHVDPVLASECDWTQDWQEYVRTIDSYWFIILLCTVERYASILYLNYNKKQNRQMIVTFRPRSQKRLWIFCGSDEALTKSFRTAFMRSNKFDLA